MVNLVTANFQRTALTVRIRIWLQPYRNCVLMIPAAAEVCPLSLTSAPEEAAEKLILDNKVRPQRLNILLKNSDS